MCTGEKENKHGQRLCYQGAVFDRILAPEYIVQGGKISHGSAETQVGESIYDDLFESENVNWRDIDEAGLVCMARERKENGMNGSQFFITLQPDLHIEKDFPCTVFGHVVRGMDVLQKLREVAVDDDDRPLAGEQVVITRCGELEFKSKKKRKEEQSDPVSDFVSEDADKMPSSSSGPDTHDTRKGREVYEKTNNGEEKRLRHRDEDENNNRNPRERSRHRYDNSRRDYDRYDRHDYDRYDGRSHSSGFRRDYDRGRSRYREERRPDGVVVKGRGALKFSDDSYGRLG